MTCRGVDVSTCRRVDVRMIRKRSSTILGIDTSCDDTSVAVLDCKTRKIISNVISSQIKIHEPFGGIVPELASRSHVENLPIIFDEALAMAGVDVSQINAVAVTNHPGLIGCLLVGTSFAKGLAYRLRVPLYAVNHLEAHLLSPFMGRETVFPYLGLVVSGGHTAFYLVESLNSIQPVGQTVDDAAGETFDKCAKMLGLSYPGGPVIEKRAALGNPEAFKFTPAKVKLGPQYLSFSGLKTAVYQIIRTQKPPLSPLCHAAESALPPEGGEDTFTNNLCASVQKAIVNELTRKMEYFFGEYTVRAFGLSGGVAMNEYLRAQCQSVCEKNHIECLIAEPQYCADNGAMIAYIALLRPSEDALFTLETQKSQKMKRQSQNNDRK